MGLPVYSAAAEEAGAEAAPPVEEAGALEGFSSWLQAAIVRAINRAQTANTIFFIFVVLFSFKVCFGPVARLPYPYAV